MSSRFRRRGSWYPRRGRKYFRRPLTKMTDQEKIALATSLLARANTILGSVDLKYVNDRGKLTEFNAIRLQLSDIARRLNELSLMTTNEVKQ